jgi:hypothetical protein
MDKEHKPVSEMVKRAKSLRSLLKIAEILIVFLKGMGCRKICNWVNSKDSLTSNNFLKFIALNI